MASKDKKKSAGDNAENSVTNGNEAVEQTKADVAENDGIAEKGNDILTQLALGILENDETLHEVYVTSDGNVFVLKNDAINHSLNIEDKTIKKVERQ